MPEGISFNDADRNFFLGVYRAAVDYYKPRIEKKTGVALGDIAVWDYSCFQTHVLKQQCGSWLLRAMRGLLFRRRIDRHAEAVRAVFDEWASKCSATYYRKGIYISFSSGTAHEDAVAAVVVHELAHALWERIAVRPLTWRPKAQYVEKYALFVEGFATYAEKVWFLDLYPITVRSVVQKEQLDPRGVHYRGLRRIEEIVRQKGPQIVPQIPKKWQSL